MFSHIKVLWTTITEKALREFQKLKRYVYTHILLLLLYFKVFFQRFLLHTDNVFLKSWFFKYKCASTYGQFLFFFFHHIFNTKNTKLFKTKKRLIFVKLNLFIKITWSMISRLFKNINQSIFFFFNKLTNLFLDKELRDPCLSINGYT